jgi:phosphoglycerol transferase MdoB-like AlkP superfamily enzyme
MENTLFEAPEYPTLEKLKQSLILFVKYGIALLATIFLLRFFELGNVTLNGKIPQNLLSLITESLFFDLIYFFKSLLFLYLPFVVFYFSFSSKRGFYMGAGIVFSIYLFIYIALIKYYFTALVPLGADLYGYSLTDIKQTITAGTSFDLFSVFICTIPFIFLWIGLKLAERVHFIKLSTAITVVSIGLMLLFLDISSVPPEKDFKSDYDYNLAINKEAYFFENSYRYFFDSEPEVDIYASNYFDDENDLNGKGFVFVNDQYPFLRKNDAEDVLGDFFSIDSLKKPNIIFIQVEGLGRAFSGPNAYLGSFTPFLDQLRNRSLYFENFLAAQGRTFASLPSILGSLPFFEKGYNSLGNAMPKALTTFSLLKNNGYQTSFLMGTSADFDNEGLFLKSQGVSELVQKTNFKSFPANHNSYWGYPDLDLMKKAISYYSGKLSSVSFVSYLQTISMHTPYKVPDMDGFYEKVENQMDKLGFDDEQKDEHRSYKNQYASIMYTDEALSYFFNEYAKLPIYQNTIFIITGDHRLPEIPMATKIDRYHVPLIIFSPMLKRSSNIRSVSSHLDIAPSLTAFLARRYKIKSPTLVTWVGSGLDTVKQFRNIHKYPLKQTVNDLFDYLSGESFISGKRVFNLTDKMGLEDTADPSKYDQLSSEFNSYKARNNRLIKTLKLLPDSIYFKYAKK